MLPLACAAWLGNYPAHAGTSQTSERAATPRLTVRIYGFPELPMSLIKEAAAEARRMLEGTKIQFTWLDCVRPELAESCMGPGVLTDLDVRIIPTALPQATEAALGFTAVESETSAAAFIFYDRVSALQSRTRPPATVLGRVLAHEIGHMLLPAGGHCDVGLMRGQWSAADLAVTSLATLGIPKRSMQSMRREAFLRMLLANRSAEKLRAGI